MLLRDPTASFGKNSIMRRRSFHTRGRVEKLLQDPKGNSLDSDFYTKVLGNKYSYFSAQKAEKYVSLVTLVKKEVQLYKNKQGIYNGLINILKNPEFLIACYEYIRDKPVDITKNGAQRNVEAISLNEFRELGLNISKGILNFLPGSDSKINKGLEDFLKEKIVILGLVLNLEVI